MRLLLPAAGPLPAGGLEELYDAGRGPLLRAGFVLSVDGAVAVQGRSRGLHTPSDGEVFRALRALADAVLVGAGTARAEGYRAVRLSEPGRRWRARTGRAEQVPVVLVTRSCDLDPAAPVLVDGPAVVLTCGAAPADRRQALAKVADVLVCGDDAVDLAEGVDRLRERGLAGLLCEGGPQLLHDLLEAGLVDELCATVSPSLVGGSPLLATALGTARPVQPVSVVDGGDGALLCRWRLQDALGAGA